MAAESSGSGPRRERPRYLVLVRHGHRDHDWRQPEASQRLKGWSDWWWSDAATVDRPAPAGGETPKSDFSTEGLPRVRAMAGSLADELSLAGVDSAVVWHSEHAVARDTASVLEQVLRTRGLPHVERAVENTALTPSKTRNHDSSGLEAKTEVRFAVIAIEERGACRTDSSAALIVVGHQPALTEIAIGLGVKLPAGTLPLGASEMACISLNKPPALEWLLTSTSDAAVAELKEKIKSKFNLASLTLTGFVVNAGLIINKEVWTLNAPASHCLIGFGSLFALLALALTVATLFAYDELLMPTQFWSEASGTRGRGFSRLLDWLDWAVLRHAPDRRAPPWSVPRPPSSDHMLRYFEMINIWKRLFLPALFLELLSITLFMTAIINNAAGKSLSYAAECLAVLLTWLLLALLAFRRSRPHVGVND